MRYRLFDRLLMLLKLVKC